MTTQHSNETEISQLQQYIAHVQHAVMSAPDERTQMIRAFVLALAESRLTQLLLDQSNNKTANQNNSTNSKTVEYLVSSTLVSCEEVATPVAVNKKPVSKKSADQLWAA